MLTWLRLFWSQNINGQSNYIYFITFISGNYAHSDIFKSEEDEQNEELDEEEDDNEGSASSEYLTDDSGDDVGAGTNIVLALITK